MARRLLLSGLAMLVFLGCALIVSAAEIRNEWFSLDVPEGWDEVKVPMQKDLPGETLMFTNKKLNCAVSISVAPNNGEKAETVAANTRDAMQKGGMKLGPMESRDGLYYYTIEKKPATGWAFYGSNDKDLAVITIWSPKLENAKSLLDAIKAKDPGLFPKL